LAAVGRAGARRRVAPVALSCPLLGAVCRDDCAWGVWVKPGLRGCSLREVDRIPHGATREVTFGHIHGAAAKFAGVGLKPPE